MIRRKSVVVLERKQLEELAREHLIHHDPTAGDNGWVFEWTDHGVEVTWASDVPSASELAEEMFQEEIANRAQFEIDDPADDQRSISSDPGPHPTELEGVKPQ